MLEDPLLLARLQFALTAATHYMFVAFTLGLAPYILVTQLIATMRGDRARMAGVRFWGGLYVVNYGMGVLSGLVMEFQLALNWNGLHEMFGYTFAAPLAIETMSAFFIESTFLGLWIFGWDRMGRWAHLLCFLVVTVTAYTSAWWVLVSNGFLRHPMGFDIVDGVAQLTDPVAMMTNPAVVYAFLHVITGSMTLGALVVAATSAYHLMRGRDEQGIFRRGIRFAAITMCVMPTLVAVFGVSQFQIYGQDPPTSGLTYTAEEIDEIGQIGAVVENGFMSVLSRGADGTMIAAWVVMLVVGLLMLLVLPLTTHKRRRLGRRMGLAPGPELFQERPARWIRWWLAPLLIMPLFPYIGSVAGWVFRETYRQPWVVVHHLTTADAITPMSPGMAVLSFSLFSGAFAVLGTVTLWLLVRFARRGPQGGPLAERPADEPEQPAAPVHSF